MIIPSGQTQRETGSQFLLRQTLAGQVRLPNGTLTSNLVAAGSVAQAAFIIAQSTQGTFQPVGIEVEERWTIKEVPDANLVLTNGSFDQILGNTTSTSRKVQFAAKFNF